MKFVRNSILKFGTLVALFVFPFSAFAGSGGTMTYSTASVTAVPTLSGTMLVVLSLLLFAVAVRVAKQKNSGINKMFVTLLGVGSISLVTGGMQIVSKADAGAATSLGLPLINGSGSVDLNLTGYNLFTNDNSGVIVTIRTIDSCASFVGKPAKRPAPLPANIATCSVGLNINSGDGCELQCGNISED